MNPSPEVLAEVRALKHRSSLYAVEGYMLLPHRAGGREAWWKFAPGEVTPVGELTWPEAAFGFAPHRWADPDQKSIGSSGSIEPLKSSRNGARLNGSTRTGS